MKFGEVYRRYDGLTVMHVVHPVTPIEVEEGPLYLVTAESDGAGFTLDQGGNDFGNLWPLGGTCLWDNLHEFDQLEPTL